MEGNLPRIDPFFAFWDPIGSLLYAQLRSCWVPMLCPAQILLGAYVMPNSILLGAYVMPNSILLGAYVMPNSDLVGCLCYAQLDLVELTPLSVQTIGLLLSYLVSEII